jgi:alpha-1,2-mannosyltransferase
MSVSKVISDWGLQTAEFLNADRLRAWNLILAGTLGFCCLGYIGLSSGGIDPSGKAIGTDFTSFYTASKLALASHPEAAYDPQIHGAAQNALFGRKLEYSAFFYPPIFLLCCLPLALVPYLLSLALWQGITFLGYWGVTRRFGGAELGSLAIFAFPAVFLDLTHGQNAFLSATLFGAAILALNSRPLTAGVVFGCLAFKPHLGIVVPFVLLAERRWSTIFAAAATVATLAAAATATFGVHIWQAFLADTSLAASVLKDGLVEPYKMQSAYAAVRVLGGSHAIAGVTQGVVSFCILGLLVWITVRSPRREVEPPLMVLAALLVTPFLLDYDLVLLAIPLAWLFAEGRRTGFAPYEKVVMLAAYALPLFSRAMAESFGLPLAPLVIAALFAVVARRMLNKVTSTGARTNQPELQIP